MPTYDYRCDTCGTVFELFQSFHDETLVKCPTKKSGNSPAGCTSAGRGRVTRVFSAPGIAFKGSGFYKTDSRTSTGASRTGSGNGSESSSDSSSSKGSGDSSSKGSGDSSSASTKAETKSASKSSGD